MKPRTAILIAALSLEEGVRRATPELATINDAAKTRRIPRITGRG
jgi:hypothetical protein